MSVTVFIVDAFTKVAGEGNRAGVVLDAEGLSAAQMQDIAAFAGYSETAFVLPADDSTHDVHVRYFTPTKEVPICGHATVATHFLRAKQQNYLQSPICAKTGAGILPVALEEDSQSDLRVVMTQAEPEFGHIFDADQTSRLADALGIGIEDFADDLPIQVVSTGHSKIMVPMKAMDLLNQLSPNMAALSSLSEEVDCNGFFPFVIDLSSKEEIQTFGRMFAPAIGIDEDPVTGNANGPAGAYLEHYGIVPLDNGSASYIGHQGIAMGKPGFIEVRLNRQESGASLTVQVVGNAVQAGTREYNG